MKGVLLLGILLSLGLAQETSLVETSSTSQIIRLQEQGLGPQNEVPLAREEDESEFELFSRFMELEAEARPGPKKESRAPRKAVDPLRPKARKLARKLVRDLKKGLQNNFYKNFEQAAADHTKDFATHLFAKCRGYAITPALCNNLLVIYRESFNKQNPFSQKNRPRFRAAIAEIHMKFIRAWRLAQSQPKGNPFASVPDGVDPFKGLRLRTDVNGHLNRFGKVNAPNEVSAKELKRAGILSDGSENKNGNGVWMADRAIKELATRLRKDLRSLRTEVVRVFGKGKFAPAILAKGTRRQAAERVVKICRNLKQQIDLAPTFCKSVGFLMQVNFVGRNPLSPKSIDKFGSVLAAFMQHNHRHAVRGGDIKVARRPSYAQDTIAITVNLKLRVTPNRFNLRSLAKEYVNVLSSILRVPEQRLRVTAVSLPRVRITFEILPAKNDKVRESNPNSPDSVDALALMFRGMAKDKTSDFYKSPILCRVLPRSVVVSKLLGVGFYKAKAIRKMKVKAAGKPPASAKPRFAQDLGEGSSNVQVLQQALQAINTEEQNEDTLTEEEEEQLATEYDQETDAVENPEAMPSEESEEATTSASFLEAVASADEEADTADMTEFDVDVPSDSEAERATDPWLVFLSTRSDEFLTAEQEGDAEDTDEAEEADEEDEELAKEAAEDSMFDEEIPAGAFIEEEEEEVSEEATEQQEEEEEEEESETAAVEVAAKTAAEPTVLLETDVMIEKAINNGLQQIATGAASSVSTSVFALLCSMCLALMMAL